MDVCHHYECTFFKLKGLVFGLSTTSFRVVVGKIKFAREEKTRDNNRSSTLVPFTCVNDEDRVRFSDHNYWPWQLSDARFTLSLQCKRRVRQEGPSLFRSHVWSKRAAIPAMTLFHPSWSWIHSYAQPCMLVWVRMDRLSSTVLSLYRLVHPFPGGCPPSCVVHTDAPRPHVLPWSATCLTLGRTRRAPPRLPFYFLPSIQLIPPIVSRVPNYPVPNGSRPPIFPSMASDRPTKLSNHVPGRKEASTHARGHSARGSSRRRAS